MSPAQILFMMCATCAQISGPPTIVDGDTVRIDATTIRLKGIDAAERQTLRGDAATELLRRIIGQQSLTCAVTGEKTRGREVGFCVTETGVDIARELIRSGAALACPRWDRRYLIDETLEARVAQPRASYCIPRTPQKGEQK